MQGGEKGEIGHYAHPKTTHIIFSNKYNSVLFLIWKDI